MSARWAAPGSCEYALNRLDDYVDGELPVAEARRVRAHLATCAECASRFRFETEALARIRDRVRGIPVPFDLGDRIRRRLEEAAR